VSVAEQREENRQADRAADVGAEAKAVARRAARQAVRERRERLSIEAMRAQVRASHERRTLHRQAVALVSDEEAQRQRDAQAVAQHDEPSKGPLVLLSARRQTALFRFERYDERSLIENWVNRDGKQHFGLGESLARNEQAMWSATVFSAVALALYRALSIERESSMDALDHRCEVLGVLRYRRQNEKKNRGLIIIVVDGLYTIMPMAEFAAMSGYAVR